MERKCWARAWGPRSASRRPGRSRENVKGAALHYSMYALPLSCGLGKCDKTGVSGF